MKIAITIWNEIVSPLFDVSSRIMIIENEKIEYLDVSGMCPFEKIDKLELKKIDIFLCGAISLGVRVYAKSKGIEVYPFITGNVREILETILTNKAEIHKYQMPGCGRRHRRFRNCRN
ncbi:MAG: hypothetical protein JXR48_09085 [Candidatus Delongbacteria bacterium]|nr:hypothetical protein [Candidatus Delongbacteria bacterium]MBN2835105.1 hypothetical protein [Candidatus Delongbacteria bacterium]